MGKMGHYSGENLIGCWGGPQQPIRFSSAIVALYSLMNQDTNWSGATRQHNMFHFHAVLEKIMPNTGVSAPWRHSLSLPEKKLDPTQRSPLPQLAVRREFICNPAHYHKRFWITEFSSSVMTFDNLVWFKCCVFRIYQQHWRRKNVTNFSGSKSILQSDIASVWKDLIDKFG